MRRSYGSNLGSCRYRFADFVERLGWLGQWGGKGEAEDSILFHTTPLHSIPHHATPHHTTPHHTTSDRWPPSRSTKNNRMQSSLSSRAYCIVMLSRLEPHRHSPLSSWAWKPNPNEGQPTLLRLLPSLPDSASPLFLCQCSLFGSWLSALRKRRGASLGRQLRCNTRLRIWAAQDSPCVW